jgi:hypothetical protein
MSAEPSAQLIIANTTDHVIVGAQPGDLVFSTTQPGQRIIIGTNNTNAPLVVTDTSVTASNISVTGTIYASAVQTTGDVNLIDITARDAAFSNVTVEGDLTVKGQKITMNVSEVTIEDNLIVINKNQTGTPLPDMLSGIEVERGDLQNYQFVFEEATEMFKVGESNSLQAVATRKDTVPAGTVSFWDASSNLYTYADDLVVSEGKLGVKKAAPVADLHIGGSAIVETTLSASNLAASNATIAQDVTVGGALNVDGGVTTYSGAVDTDALIASANVTGTGAFAVVATDIATSTNEGERYVWGPMLVNHVDGTELTPITNPQPVPVDDKLPYVTLQPGNVISVRSFNLNLSETGGMAVSFVTRTTVDNRYDTIINLVDTTDNFYINVSIGSNNKLNVFGKISTSTAYNVVSDNLFTDDKFHAVTLIIRQNSSIPANGEFVLYVDGQLADTVQLPNQWSTMLTNTTPFGGMLTFANINVNGATDWGNQVRDSIENGGSIDYAMLAITHQSLSAEQIQLLHEATIPSPSLYAMGNATFSTDVTIQGTLYTQQVNASNLSIAQKLDVQILNAQSATLSNSVTTQLLTASNATIAQTLDVPTLNATNATLSNSVTTQQLTASNATIAQTLDVPTLNANSATLSNSVITQQLTASNATIAINATIGQQLDVPTLNANSATLSNSITTQQLTASNATIGSKLDVPTLNATSATLSNSVITQQLTASNAIIAQKLDVPTLNATSATLSNSVITQQLTASNATIAVNATVGEKLDVPTLNANTATLSNSVITQQLTASNATIAQQLDTQILNAQSATLSNSVITQQLTASNATIAQKLDVPTLNATSATLSNSVITQQLTASNATIAVNATVGSKLDVPTLNAISATLSNSVITQQLTASNATIAVNATVGSKLDVPTLNATSATLSNSVITQQLTASNATIAVNATVGSKLDVPTLNATSATLSNSVITQQLTASNATIAQKLDVPTLNANSATLSNSVTTQQLSASNATIAVELDVPTLNANNATLSNSVTTQQLSASNATVAQTLNTKVINAESATLSNSVTTQQLTASNATVKSITVNGDSMLSGNVDIAGNLTVQGDTVIMNTSTVTIEDNLILLNKNQTGTPATFQLSGFEVERGDLSNVQFVFSEEDGVFKAGFSNVLQAIATRDDVLANGAVAYWNSTDKKFTSASDILVSGNRLGVKKAVPGATIHVGGDAIVDTSFTASNITTSNLTVVQPLDATIASSKVIPGSFSNGPYTFPNNLSITGTLTQTGATAFQSTTNTFSNVTVNSNLTASNIQASNITALSLAGALPANNVTAGSFQNAAYTFPNNLSITGTTTHTGATAFQSTTNTFSNATINSNLTASNIQASNITALSLAGALPANNVTAGSFQNAAYTFPNNVTVTGTLSASLPASSITTGSFQNAAYTFPNNVTVQGTLTQTGATTFASTTNTFSNVTVNSNLTASNIQASNITALTLSGALAANNVTAGSFQNAAYTFPNNLSITGTLTQTGATAFQSTTNTFSNATVNSNLTASNIQASNIIVANGVTAATLSGALTANNVTAGVFQNAAYTFPNNLSITGTLTQTGATAFQSTTNTFSNITVNSNLTASNIQASNIRGVQSTIGFGYLANAPPTNGLLVQGNLGLGTTTPSNLLTVGGRASIGVNYVGSNAPTNGLIVESNVGIGTATPQYLLHVHGSTTEPNIFTNGDITCFSDSRCKTDLVVIADALDKVLSINGYTFNRVEDPNGRRHAGVIAQEVREILPEVIYTDSNGFLSVAYANMVPLLIQAIHELKDKYDAEIAELKAKLA